MRKRNFPIYKIFVYNRMGILGIFEITVGTG